MVYNPYELRSMFFRVMHLFTLDIRLFPFRPSQKSFRNDEMKFPLPRKSHSHSEIHFCIPPGARRRTIHRVRQVTPCEQWISAAARVTVRTEAPKSKIPKPREGNLKR